MEIKIGHLAPYLPYGLNFIHVDIWHDEDLLNHTTIMEGILDETIYFMKEGEQPLNQFKPILRPLSDLTKEIVINGTRFIPRNLLTSAVAWEEITKASHLNHMYYACMILLFQWHFDVFGLIEKGLAIDINTL